MDFVTAYKEMAQGKTAEFKNFIWRAIVGKDYCGEDIVKTEIFLQKQMGNNYMWENVYNLCIRDIISDEWTIIEDQMKDDNLMIKLDEKEYLEKCFCSKRSSHAST